MSCEISDGLQLSTLSRWLALHVANAAPQAIIVSVLPSYSHRRFVRDTFCERDFRHKSSFPHGSGFLEIFGKTCHALTMLAIGSLIVV